MDGQTLGLLLIALAFSSVPAGVLLAMEKKRMTPALLGLLSLIGFVLMAVGTLYLLGKLK